MGSRIGAPVSVATNVSENGLKKKEDDAPPMYGGVIGNGTVLAQHGTLEKLTLRLSLNEASISANCNLRA